MRSSEGEAAGRSVLGKPHSQGTGKVSLNQLSFNGTPSLSLQEATPTSVTVWTSLLSFVSIWRQKNKLEASLLTLGVR